MEELSKIFSFLVGIILSLLMIWLNFEYGITYSSLKGYSDILYSTINFLSIIIGFYSVFYGLIFSIRKTKFFLELSKSRYRNNLLKLLINSLCSVFSCLILTIAMQSLIKYELMITTILFYVWFFLVGVSITYTFQMYLLLIAIIFEADPQKKQKKDLKI